MFFFVQKKTSWQGIVWNSFSFFMHIQILKHVKENSLLWIIPFDLALLIIHKFLLLSYLLKWNTLLTCYNVYCSLKLTQWKVLSSELSEFTFSLEFHQPDVVGRKLEINWVVLFGLLYQLHNMYLVHWGEFI